MKKSELKELIKPIVAECVKESVREIMLESGLLAAVISEVVKGVGQTQLVEKKVPQRLTIEEDEDEDLEQMRRRTNMGLGKHKNLGKNPITQKLQETKKQLVDNIGKTGYTGLNDKFNGVNLFEGIKDTIPDETETSPGNPLAGVAPNDPGINIDGLFDFTRLQANLNGRKNK